MELQVLFYPKVNALNQLEFDPEGPVPKELPYFKRHPEIPWIFIPDFPECIHRGTVKRKLSNCPTCTRQRDVWYCNHFKEEIFPTTCASCTNVTCTTENPDGQTETEAGTPTQGDQLQG